MPRTTSRLVPKQRMLPQQLPQEHVRMVQPARSSQSVRSYAQKVHLLSQDNITQEEIAEEEIVEDEIAEDEIAQDEIAQDEIVEDEIIDDGIIEEEVDEEEVDEEEMDDEDSTQEDFTQEQITQEQIIQEQIRQAQVKHKIKIINQKIMLLQAQLRPKRKSDLVVKNAPLLAKRTKQSPSAFKTPSQSVGYVITSNRSHQYVSSSTPLQAPKATKSSSTVMQPSLKNQPKPRAATRIPTLSSSKQISPHPVLQQKAKTPPTTPTKSSVSDSHISPGLNNTRPTSANISNRMPLQLSQRRGSSLHSSSSSSKSPDPFPDKVLPSSARKYLQTYEVYDNSDFDDACRAAEMAQLADGPSKDVQLEDTYRNLVFRITDEYRSLFSPFKATPPKPIRFEFVPRDLTEEVPEPHPSVRVYGDYIARRGFPLQGNLVQTTTSDRIKSRACKESDLYKYETHFVVTLDTKEKRAQLLLYIINLFFFTQFIVLTNKDLVQYLEDPYESPILSTKLWTVPDVTKYQASALDQIHSFKENSSLHIRQYIDARFKVASFILQAAFPRNKFLSPISYSLVMQSVRTLYVKENRKYLLHKSRFRHVGDSPNLCHTELCFYWPFQPPCSDDSAVTFLVRVEPPGEPVDS